MQNSYILGSINAGSTFNYIAGVPNWVLGTELKEDATYAGGTQVYAGTDSVYNIYSGLHAIGKLGGKNHIAFSTVPSISNTHYYTMFAGSLGPAWNDTLTTGYMYVSHNIYPNSSATWTDITNNLNNVHDPYNGGHAENPFSYNTLTDVEIKTDDSNTVWLTFGGFKGSKVVVTWDGGNHWYDMSNGLPDFPVNRIVYRNGTNEELYAATDAGVYQWQQAIPGNDTLGTWVCYNE